MTLNSILGSKTNLFYFLKNNFKFLKIISMILYLLHIESYSANTQTARVCPTQTCHSQTSLTPKLNYHHIGTIFLNKTKGFQLGFFPKFLCKQKQTAQVLEWSWQTSRHFSRWQKQFLLPRTEAAHPWMRPGRASRVGAEPPMHAHTHGHTTLSFRPLGGRVFQWSGPWVETELSMKEGELHSWMKLWHL